MAVLFKQLKGPWRSTLGVFMSLFSGFCALLILVINKKIVLEAGLSPVVNITMRYVLLFIVLLPVMLKDRFRFLPTNKVDITFTCLRDILSMIALMCWYRFSALVPVNNAIAISFFMPIFTVLIWSFMTRIRVTHDLYISIGLCIAGMLYITGFTADKHLYYYLALVLISFLRALVSVVSKKLVHRSVKDAMLCTLVIQFLISVVVLFVNFESMPQYLHIRVLFMLTLISFVYILFLISFLISIRLADLNFLQPFDFLRIVFAVALSYFYLDEVFTVSDVIGTALIIGGICYLIGNNALRSDITF